MWDEFDSGSGVSLRGRKFRVMGHGSGRNLEWCK